MCIFAPKTILLKLNCFIVLASTALEDTATFLFDITTAFNFSPTSSDWPRAKMIQACLDRIFRPVHRMIRAQIRTKFYLNLKYDVILETTKATISVPKAYSKRF